MKISVFGDESSSRSIASYGLIAFAEADLPAVGFLGLGGGRTRARNGDPLIRA
jgi:hypothetical protein